MKRIPLIAAATLTLLMTSAPVASQGKAQEEVLMPEIAVTGEAAARQHPQDSNWSERPLGCVEVVTPGALETNWAVTTRRGTPVKAFRSFPA